MYNHKSVAYTPAHQTAIHFPTQTEHSRPAAGPSCPARCLDGLIAVKEGVQRVVCHRYVGRGAASLAGGVVLGVGIGLVCGAIGAMAAAPVGVVVAYIGNELRASADRIDTEDALWMGAKWGAGLGALSVGGIAGTISIGAGLCVGPVLASTLE
jgi:hypothetical protein